MQKAQSLQSPGCTDGRENRMPRRQTVNHTDCHAGTGKGGKHEIHEFLEIQRYRYDNDFIFTVEADESLLEAYIPKMLIQPLVENACVHGLKSATERREGSLRIRQSSEGMIVQVTDHGEGMTGERLQEVRCLLREGDNRMHSVGLNNVQRRCRLYYGEAARLDVDALPDGGSVFTLILPVFWKKEDFHVPDSDRG